MFFNNAIIDIRDSLQSITRRPTRSFLSGLGIGVGVMAIFVMLSISEGAKVQALHKIASMGVNNLRIENASNVIQAHEKTYINLSNGLTESDVGYLRQYLEDIVSIAAYVRSDSYFLNKKKSAATTVMGVTPEWLSVEGVQLDRGRPLIPSDLLEMKRICFLGAGIAEHLQANLGSWITLSGATYIVTGIFKPKGRLLSEGTGLSTLDFNQAIVIPLNSYPHLEYQSGRRLLDGIIIKFSSMSLEKAERITNEVNKLLLVSHHAVKDFNVVAPFEILGKSNQEKKSYSLIIGIIAIFSLIMGGVGVMNVMFANIAEKTQEIGLRMALGATPSRILNLFLFHAILLCLFGSIWGLGFGIILVELIQQLMDWEVAYSLFGFILSIASAFVSGLIFGVYPALRAADLEAVVALRDT